MEFDMVLRLVVRQFSPAEKQLGQKYSLCGIPIYGEFYKVWHNQAMEFKLRVLIVDDEPLVRSLLTEVVKSLGYETRCAESAAEARKICQTFDADVAIIDVDLGPGPNGFDLAINLRTLNSAIAIVFLTNMAQPKLAGRSAKDLPAGYAYLVKSRMGEVETLNEVIKKASAGRGGDYRDDLQYENPLAELSRSQLEVVRLLAQGKSNEEIAEARGTTVRAVRMILVRAFQAMGISEDAGPEKRVQAAIKYLKTAGPIK